MGQSGPSQKWGPASFCAATVAEFARIPGVSVAEFPRIPVLYLKSGDLLYLKSGDFSYSSRVSALHLAVTFARVSSLRIG